MNPSMPAKGSSVFTPYSGVLPEGKGETINAGIPLFELVCIGTPIGTQIFGFHDVDTKLRQLEHNMNFGLKYEPKWQRGFGKEREYMKYEYDKTTGRSYAYIPDDPAWHNVIRLAETIDSGKFAISQYFVSGGVISGAVKTEELRFIASCIFDHSVTSMGKVLFRSKVLAEAQACEMDQKSKGIQCQTIASKIPEIESLVKRYGVTWNHQPAFIDGIRKDIEDKIKAKFYPESVMAQQVSDPMAIVSAAFASLTNQQRLELFQKQMSAPAISTAPALPEKKKINIDTVAMPQLKELAEDMDIFIKGMQREDIIKAIKEKWAEAADEQQSSATQKAEEFK